MNILKQWMGFYPFILHRLHQQIYFYLNCTTKVVYYILKWTTQVAQNHFRVNLRVRVFWENQFFNFFFSFLGPQSTIFLPQHQSWPQKPHFWGGQTSGTFWSEQWFRSWKCQNRPLFWQNQPWKSQKLLLRSKSFRSLTPQKVGFLRPTKVLGSKNSVLGPQKIKNKVEKIDFLKKPELLDLPESGFGVPGWSTSKCSIPLSWYNSNKNKFSGVTCVLMMTTL